eukprot:EG_transcript_21254
MNLMAPPGTSGAGTAGSRHALRRGGMGPAHPLLPQSIYSASVSHRSAVGSRRMLLSRPGDWLEGPSGYSPDLVVAWLLLAGVAYLAGVWPARPRGWSDPALVQVRTSPVAGKGLFATAPIPAGAVLGAYPGRLRNGPQVAQKLAAAPVAQRYFFRANKGMLLDPTDSSGELSGMPAPGLPWFPVDVSLAYINEPPRGSRGTNVTVEDDPNDEYGLVCVAARDIEEGEEIFMDYGVHYDRSGYLAP